jgi:hypothetical protein
MENKQQTPLMRLIAELKRRILILNNEPNGILRETMIQTLLVDCDSYLAYEREVIEKVHEDGFVDGADDSDMPKLTVQEYFQKTFQTNE